ncbi:MAG: ABC transporter ATP-binding protein [Clostridia bacterium]|nr:ABC transporter ATP-binding protein [Clostridia bacterium]
MKIDISAKNLQKTYTGKTPTFALKGVDFNISSGEFLAIMGKSGSGKSTLLHQLALLDTPTAGELIVDEVDTANLSDQEKTTFRLQRLGYIFQEYALIFELNALENVLLPAFALNGYYQNNKDKAREMLAKVGLSERANHRPNELSGGEQQRVAIARALINSPKILFADEPTANLDTATSKEVLSLFRKLNKELGQTIVLVTHEPENRQYVDRIIWLKDGLLEKTEIVNHE